MWDPSMQESDQPQRRSVLRFLPSATIALLGAGLAGCLYWHPELTSSGFSLASHETPVSTTASSNASTPINTAAALSTTATISRNLTSDQPAAAAPTGDLTATQLEAMIGQLQSMQIGLQGVAQQLDQRYPSSKPTAAPLDVPTMLAEIDRLNQVMQPLMKQIEAAIESGRSESEIAAMRTEMDEIHRRLDELMEAVQSAREANSIP